MRSRWPTATAEADALHDSNMDRLPLELKALVVAAVGEVPEDDDSPWPPPGICSLRLCSTELAELSSAVLFSRVVLAGDEPERLEQFASNIAPKFGRYVTHLVAMSHYRAPRSASAEAEADDDDDDDEESATAEEEAVMRKTLTTLAKAMPFLTRLQQLGMDVAEGHRPLGLSPEDDPLMVAASTHGHSITHLNLTRQGVGDPTVSPSYLAPIIRQMSRLENLGLTAVAKGETAAEEDALVDAMRSLEKVEDLRLLFCECFNGRMGDGEWKAPLKQLHISCCNQLTLKSIARALKPFEETLISLKLVTFADSEDDVADPSLPLAPLPPISLPKLTALQLESVMPIRLLQSFSNSPLLIVSLASMDTPSIDSLGDTPDKFTGVISHFLGERMRKAGPSAKGLQAIMLNEDDWEPHVLISVVNWCHARGVAVELVPHEDSEVESDDEEAEAGGRWSTDEDYARARDEIE